MATSKHSEIKKRIEIFSEESNVHAPETFDVHHNSAVLNRSPQKERTMEPQPRFILNKGHSLPIRLTPMTATCRVPPLSRVKLGIGWSRGVARDAEQ